MKPRARSFPAPILLILMAVLCPVRPSAAQNLTTVYSFGEAPHDGANPDAGVVRDSQGNLYGTTGGGGTNVSGVVFKIDSAGQETVLYNFCSVKNCADGAYPLAGLVLDAAGNLYGTTTEDGPGFDGVVFKLDTTGQETVLYGFTGGADGGYPWAPVLLDASGNLYGTTQYGGDLNCNPGMYYAGCGVVFKVDASGHETVLHTFTGAADGAFPVSGLIQDSEGNLYGTTTQGGRLKDCSLGCGVIFRVSPAGKETVLYTFVDGADGVSPRSGLIRDGSGNLYGTTEFGGTPDCTYYTYTGCGVVFKLDSAGHETVLYRFTGGADGSHPSGSLIRDAKGNLYDATAYGGGYNYACENPRLGCGVLFKVSGINNETVLHNFDWTDGESPNGGLIRNGQGGLYGTTVSGGAYGGGTVFEITP